VFQEHEGLVWGFCSRHAGSLGQQRERELRDVRRFLDRCGVSVSEFLADPFGSFYSAGVMAAGPRGGLSRYSRVVSSASFGVLDDCSDPSDRFDTMAVVLTLNGVTA
jgi:hypothetical protein